MAGVIPALQASPLYTGGLLKKYDELAEIKVNNFFRSFFPAELCRVRYPAIDVRRGTEKVAVDVLRGNQGTRVQITKSSQKAFDPFYYKLYSDATEQECYFRVFGSTSFNLNDMAELINGVAIENKVKQDMIERAIELHCASIMENGTCTSLRNGDIVDFKRQAGSMVDLGVGAYWTVNGTNPFTDLKAGGDWLRQKGKSNGFVINAVFGTTAWTAFRANSVVNTRLAQFNNKRDLLQPAQLESTGAIYQGEIDCDSYVVRCWTYNEFYDDPTTGASTPYMNPKKVYMVPEKPNFTLLYGAIPQVVATGTDTSKLAVGQFIYKRFINEEAGYDRMYIESAPLPVPKAVDQMYTVQVVA